MLTEPVSSIYLRHKHRHRTFSAGIEEAFLFHAFQQKKIHLFFKDSPLTVCRK